jgi:hypothetical protein
VKKQNKGQTNFKQQLRHTGKKFLNNVEVSAQKAVYILPQMPLNSSSRQVVFINTGSLADRVYLLRNDISNLTTISLQDTASDQRNWKTSV